MQDKVIILGAGLPEGVGGALARRFAREDLHVFVSGRTLEKVEQTAAQITASGGSAEAIEADVTSEDDLDALFSKAGEREGALAAVIYNAGNNMPIPFADLSPEQFEFYWRVGCYGGFLTAKRAMPILEAQGEGSMLFTGASASLRGKPMFGHFAAAKAALRNLAQSLAREYGPKGVHVAHIIIDGVVNGDRAQTNFGDYLDNLGPDGALDPDAIADAYWTIHAQQRSAWTHELDLRPFSETW
ncbi:SDR family NAD(P)-dependent oxidoreductase [Parasphingorhabdus flavimaris]|jgi:NAD(P)-dependent dehydrogenase (short-subunit alcohol dehydrogenase family)|uniref:SDR family NAD(P)-dependent oxidoreductase n=1 Tax=Parasphingorhabdus flavimaris TaxID=266812 RepID=A0ABX2N2R5_9SPHN|nr:SDR family NAD(P)-dependent oxidoreductase [Parasphingorhabdus flavimaris]NVD28005.1 SDR family NAD(P)-dependent oxidoreductase [Parasphingorhabdus flavimaris]|tara:strand:+ start:923 stop:1651 length:729 start_codon:yes stop_codon:yes gene_type:complete